MFAATVAVVVAVVPALDAARACVASRVQPLRGLPEQINEQVAFGLRKDSELTPVFNLAVQEMDQGQTP